MGITINKITTKAEGVTFLHYRFYHLITPDCPNSPLGFLIPQ
jgi:hypothetical protein